MILFLRNVFNIGAAFLGGFLFFLRFLGVWQWNLLFPGFILITLVNVYGCYRIVLAKNFLIAHTLKKFEEKNNEESEDAWTEEKTELEQRLQSEMLLSDIAAHTFGPLGCFLIDCCVAFLQFGWLTHAAPIVADSLAKFFENRTVTYNETTGENLVHLISHPQDFTIAMVVLFCCFAATVVIRTVRQCNVLSAIGCLSATGLLVMAFLSIDKLGFKEEEKWNFPENESYPQTASQLIPHQVANFMHKHRLMTIQAFVALFTVETSMRDNRRAFLPAMCVFGLLTLFFGCFFAYGLPATGMLILQKLESYSATHIFVIICIIGIFPIQNMPLYHVLARRFLSNQNCCIRRTNNDSRPLQSFVSFFERGRQSFILDMRQENYQRLTLEDVANDIVVKVPWRYRYPMRIIIVMLQILTACLFHHVETLETVYMFMGLFASRFLVMIFPLATYLRQEWYSICMVMKLVNIIIIFCTMAEASVACYILARDL